MKTSGICNAQSARKHRRQGHIVVKAYGNRYMWQACSAPGAVVRNNLPSIVMNGRFGKLADENRQLQAYAAGAVLTRTAGATVTHVPTGITVEHRASYWPKRRNQHSKPYIVVGFQNGDVIYIRQPEQTASSRMTLDAFVEAIGKRVQ